MNKLKTEFESIQRRLDAITNELDELLENPVFINTIHGEQEMQLELTIELLESITSKFQLQEVTVDKYAAYQKDDLSDAS
jgi:hypothetical protein